MAVSAKRARAFRVRVDQRRRFAVGLEAAGVRAAQVVPSGDGETHGGWSEGGSHIPQWEMGPAICVAWGLRRVGLGPEPVGWQQVIDSMRAPASEAPTALSQSAPDDVHQQYGGPSSFVTVNADHELLSEVVEHDYD